MHNVKKNIAEATRKQNKWESVYGPYAKQYQGMGYAIPTKSKGRNSRAGFKGGTKIRRTNRRITKRRISRM